MTYLMLIWLFLIIIGIAQKDSKFWAIVILTFAWILVGWNYESPDMENYVWKYEASDTWFGAFFGTGSVEPGYSFLCYLGNKLGLSFMQFKQIVSAISYVLILSFIFSVGRNYALVAACYLASIFVIDVVQIRNFFAMAVFLFGFRYLLKPLMKPTDVAKYIVCALIASSIHISMVLSFLFLLSKKSIKLWHVIVLVVAAFLMKATIFGFFTNTLDSDKVGRYEGLSSILGGVANTVVFCTSASVIMWAYKKQIKRKSLSSFLYDGLALKNSNLLLLVVIPFLFDNGSYSRLLKDVLIANYAYLSFVLRGKEKFILYGYVLFFLLYYVFLDENRLMIFDAVFKYNDFFGS